MRWLLVVVAVALVAGFLFGRSLTRPAIVSPTVVDRLRAVARLQVLDASVTRTVRLLPEPVEQRTLTASLAQWARYAVAPPSGTAVVAAEAHFSIDLSHFDERSVWADGDTVQVVLPEPELSVELSPGATQVLVSNLDSEQTNALLAKAKDEFVASLARDPKLLEEARESGRRGLTVLIQTLGFKQVRFVTARGPFRARLSAWPLLKAAPRGTTGPHLRTG